MANPTGDITLNVSLDTNNVKVTAADLKSSIENIFKESKGQNLSSSFQSAQVQAVKLYDSITNIESRMAAMESSGITKQNLGAYTALTQQLNNVTNSATIVRDRLVNMSAELDNSSLQAQKSASVFDGFKQRVSTNLSYIATGASSIKEYFAGMANSIKDSAVGKAISNIEKGLKLALAPAKQLAVQFNKLASSAIKNGLSKLSDAVKSVGRHTSNSNNMLELGFKKLVQYGFGIRTVFLLVKKLRNALIEGFGNIAQYSGDFNTLVSQFVSALGTLKNSFATAFAPIATVAIPLLTGLMDALIDVMNLIGKFFAALTGKSTFIQAKRVQKDYAQSLKDTGKSGNSAAKGLKNAEKAAKEAQKTIAGFDDVEILKEDKDTSPSSSGGGSGGGGIGGAGKAGEDIANMFETVPIESKIKDFADKIRSLIAAQDWTGLGTFLGECINSVFEKALELISWENVGDKITFFVNAITTTLNALVTAIDWDLIGRTFAAGVNTIVNTLLLLVTGINWENIGAGFGTALDSLFRDINWGNLAKLVGEGLNAIINVFDGFVSKLDLGRTGKDIFSGLNTAISTVNWKKLGTSLGKAFNGVIDFLYSAITTFDWKNAAKSLFSSINAFIKKVDWKKAGRTYSELLKGVLEFIGTAIGEFDWAGAVEALWDAFVSVDWIGISTSAWGTLAGTIGKIAGELVKLIGKAISEALTSIGDYFNDEIDAAGGDVITGLYNGITKAIVGIGTWIKEHIFQPFIDGFKSAFGIASPSTVMEEQGGFITEGLLNGITNNFGDVTSFFSNGVKGIINIFKKGDWKDAGSDAVSKTQTGADKKWPTLTKSFTNNTKSLITNFKNSDWNSGGETSANKINTGVSGAWSGIANTFTTKTNSLISSYKNASWKDSGQSSVSTIKSGVSSNWSTLSGQYKTGITNIRNDIKNAEWSGTGKSTVTGLASGINNNWSDSIYKNVQNKIVNVITYIRERQWSGAGNHLVGELHNGINDNWGDKITTLISNKISGIKDKFNNTNWKSIGENICSGISNGIRNTAGWISDAAKKAAKDAYDAARDKLDINSPSKLFRDGVGKAIPEGIAVGIEQGTGMTLNAIKHLTDSISDTDVPDVEIPSIAIGKVIPYEAGKTTNSVDTTLTELADLLKYSQETAISKEDLEDTLRSVLPNMLRDYINFYIGDEQIARHANAGNISLNRRYSTVG